MDTDLSGRRVVSWHLLAVLFAVEVHLTVFTNLAVFRNAWIATTVFGLVRGATGEW